MLTGLWSLKGGRVRLVCSICGEEEVFSVDDVTLCSIRCHCMSLFIENQQFNLAVFQFVVHVSNKKFLFLQVSCP